MTGLGTCVECTKLSSIGTDGVFTEVGVVHYRCFDTLWLKYNSEITMQTLKQTILKIYSEGKDREPTVYTFDGSTGSDIVEYNNAIEFVWNTLHYRYVNIPYSLEKQYETSKTSMPALFSVHHP